MSSVLITILLILTTPFLAGCELFGLAPIPAESESHLGPDGIPGSPEMGSVLPTIGNSKMAASNHYKAVVSMNALSARVLSYGKNYTSGNSNMEPLVDILIDLDDDDLDRLDLQYQEVDEE